MRRSPGAGQSTSVAWLASLSLDHGEQRLPVGDDLSSPAPAARFRRRAWPGSGLNARIAILSVGRGCDCDARRVGAEGRQPARIGAPERYAGWRRWRRAQRRHDLGRGGHCWLMPISATSDRGMSHSAPPRHRLAAEDDERSRSRTASRATATARSACRCRCRETVTRSSSAACARPAARCVGGSGASVADAGRDWAPGPSATSDSGTEARRGAAAWSEDHHADGLRPQRHHLRDNRGCRRR